MKRLPPRLRCEVCGDVATVLDDNLRVWNEICALPAGHPRRAEGVWMDTECPNCGINRQVIYPPDKDEQREIIITGE